MAIIHQGAEKRFHARVARLANGRQRLRSLKSAIWVYLFLLIFEGALRKWLLPGLATPLLIVRDPVAAYIVFEALRFGTFPVKPTVICSLLIALLAIPLAVLFGHGSPIVAAYGARPFFLYLPSMFAIASVLDRADLIKIGRFLLIVSIGMTFLIAIQFYSPQTAFINRGVGGADGGGFSGALDYFRPPGTFSFTSGATQFYSLVAPFVFYFWLQPSGVSITLRVSATLALFLAIPFSISRGLMFQVAVTLAFASMATLAKPRLLLRAVVAAAAGTLILAVLSQFAFFQTAIEVFLTRFSTANESEGGLASVLVDRYVGGLLVAFDDTSQSPLVGVGIGLGTNVGAMITSGQVQFLVAENEWQRLVGEMGVLLGFMAIAIRLTIAASAAWGSYKRLLMADCLPWMLLSSALTSFPQGNWAQPTSLGFSVIAMALLLASIRQPRLRSRAIL